MPYDHIFHQAHRGPYVSAVLYGGSLAPVGAYGQELAQRHILAYPCRGVYHHSYAMADIEAGAYGGLGGNLDAVFGGQVMIDEPEHGS